jgi:6-pyruvoyltetrahydropterin/6-carboxytetrahydropterin synthase
MPSSKTVKRYHDCSFGHRVVGHEGACAHIHGHNYRIWFTCASAQLDQIGRVIDFSVIKTLLCEWLEANWDHRFVAWEHDPMLEGLRALDPEGVVSVPFNPTAEDLAAHLLEVVGPTALAGTGVVLVKVKVEETRKCSAMAELI